MGGSMQKVPLCQRQDELTDGMLRRENCLLIKNNEWMRNGTRRQS